MSDLKSVVDSQGCRYSLVKRIGEGGQGVVYAVQGGRMAVKVLNSSSATDAKRYERHYHFLRSLDLSGIPIAQPHAVLAPPDIGFVMLLLPDMGAIQRLISPPHGVSSLREWYTESGGLRWRLRVCARSAHALAMLHYKGLCYGDVSPSNIFVPNSPAGSGVCLIDADNLRFESTTTTQRIYTPGYGAPEVVTNCGFASTLSDAYGLAVVAYQTLTLAHPLLGDAVDAGAPEDEEAALSGSRPWVDHPTDRSNSSTKGINRDVVLSKRLREISQRTFVGGLTVPRNRPSAAEWAEVLDRASRNCLSCTKCKASFYRTDKLCPWCGECRPKFVKGSVCVWDPSLGSSNSMGNFVCGSDTKRSVRDDFVLSVGDQLLIDERLGLGLAQGDIARGILALEYSGDKLSFRAIASDVPLEIWTKDKKQTKIKHGSTFECLVKEFPMALHIGDYGKLHRVLCLEAAQ